MNLFRRKKKDDQPLDLNERSPQLGIKFKALREVPERPGEWSVVCERPDAVLDPNAVNSADDLFQGLADRLTGEFDGWEAAAQP